MNHKTFNLSKQRFNAANEYLNRLGGPVSEELRKRIARGRETAPGSQFEFSRRVAKRLQKLCTKIKSAAVKRYEEDPDSANKQLLTLATDACHVLDTTEAMMQQ